MKKTILISVISSTSLSCAAQLSTTLVVSPQPPSSLISWGAKELTYIISSQGGSAPGRVLVKATLKTFDGTVAAATNLTRARMFTVNPAGSLILYAADVMPLDVMAFNGKYKSSLEKTGKLPAGSYELCLQLVRPGDFMPVSEERCRSFTMAAFQLPIPMMPSNEEVMDAANAQTAITFRWTPVTPRPTEMVRYIVTVFEILDRQTPMQALRSNQPLLTKEITGTTQFIWQPQLSFGSSTTGNDEKAGGNNTGQWGNPKKNISSSALQDSIIASKFIWTIQTIDSRGVPFGDGNINGDGISEPTIFTIIRDGRKIKTGPPARIIYLTSIKEKRN